MAQNVPNLVVGLDRELRAERPVDLNRAGISIYLGKVDSQCLGQRALTRTILEKLLSIRS